MVVNFLIMKFLLRAFMKFSPRENNLLYGNYSGRTTLVDEWQINFINALLYYHISGNFHGM